MRIAPGRGFIHLFTLHRILCKSHYDVCQQRWGHFAQSVVLYPKNPAQKQAPFEPEFLKPVQLRTYEVNYFALGLRFVSEQLLGTPDNLPQEFPAMGGSTFSQSLEAFLFLEVLLDSFGFIDSGDTPFSPG
jgi:hypothetical protein